MPLMPLQVNGHLTADQNDILSGTILDSAGQGKYDIYAVVDNAVTDATITVNDGRQIVVNADHIPQGSDATQPSVKCNELIPWCVYYKGDSRPRIDIAEGTSGEVEWKVVFTPGKTM